MASVTYIGRAGRIRIATGQVLERGIPTEVVTDVAASLRPADFSVVMPVRRPPARSKPKTRTPRAKARAQQKES